jgi:hypothetical protein
MKVWVVVEIIYGQEAYPNISVFDEAGKANERAERIKAENGPDWEDSVSVSWEEVEVE